MSFRKPGRREAVRGVALVGFMGAGKSTVGQGIATRLDLPFADLDALLVRRFGPIPDQLALDGLAAFRARESAVVRELCDGVERVLATGGGTFSDPLSRELLRASYRTVWLDATLSELSRRVGPGEGRPLWDAEVPRRYEERRAAYAEADLRIDTTGKGADAVVDEVIAWLR